MLGIGEAGLYDDELRDCLPVAILEAFKEEDDVQTSARGADVNMLLGNEGKEDVQNLESGFPELREAIVNELE